MKKIIAILLVFIIIGLSGCNESKPQEVKKETVAQYVIALNPSVMTKDGTVNSLRNTVASAIQKDVNKAETTLYDSTDWKWVYRENTDQNDWYQRNIRELSTWVSGTLNTHSAAPYSYKFSDDGVKSLCVYDVEKMEIKGASGADLNKNGIIFSFSGEAEEGLCYTAQTDCRIELADRSNGSIALLDSINGMNAAFFDHNSAKEGIILRIYKNNRIYWQEILDKNTASVSFPTFTGIELKAGDSVMITAQAANGLEGIVTGNCDIAPKYETVSVKKPISTRVPIEIPEEEITAVPLVKDSMSNFTVVYPDGIDDQSKKLINSFVAYAEETLSVYPEVLSDSEVEINEEEYYLLIGNTKFSESAKAISDIKGARENNAGDFIIRQESNKIVIAAENIYSLGYAIEFFKTNYCKDSKAAIDIGLDYLSANYNPIKNITLAGVPVTDYTIVHSAYSSFMETSAAEYLVDNILRLTGKIIEVTDDKSSKGKNEILIGHTNRTSNNYSVTADSTSVNEYTIKVANGSTSVLSNSNSAVNAGVIKLMSMLSGGNVSIGSYTGVYDGSYSLTNGYKLAWSEDFNGDELSKTWKKKGADGYATCHGGTTYSVMDNASVENGALKTKVELIGNDSYGVDITATGANSMYFKYGFVEGRVKMSDIQGYLSGLWVVTYTGGGATGEFDIYENAGKTDSFKPNLHIWGESGHQELLQNNTGVQGGVAPKVTIDEKFGENYHNFGMEWTDDYISFYIDGKCYYTFDCTLSDSYDTFDQYSTIVYGAFSDRGYTKLPVPEDGKISYNYVDWIRIWQKDEDGYGIRVK